LEAALAALAGVATWSDPQVAATAAVLTDRRAALLEAIDRLAAAAPGALKTRGHGDFHLGPVLGSSGDAHIIDLEGEPARAPGASGRGRWWSGGPSPARCATWRGCCARSNMRPPSPPLAPRARGKPICRGGPRSSTALSNTPATPFSPPTGPAMRRTSIAGL